MSTDSTHSRSWTLALAALGVVYGDIGTSPLYSLHECLGEGRFNPADPVTVLGPTSLMIWSLTVIVTIKYLLILSHATNQGEGGVFALLSILRQPTAGLSKGAIRVLGTFAILGAALLYGDGIITPAISVLSAVEGMKELNEGLGQYVVPISVVILFALFLVQRLGTGRIGASFGPIMLIWFALLTVLGVWQIIQHPNAFAALSPTYGVSFLAHHGLHGFAIMGSVLLCVTGCEALYADIGHFGATAMQRSWFFVAYPALVINYLGQAGLVMAEPDAVSNPFFHMVPKSLLVPIIILATMATVIASQAMITGVFSLTQQATQLGFLPRLKIIHTNAEIRGQIFLPQVNFLLGAACLALVIEFQSSDRLASAYGLSVSANMLLTSILFYDVARRVWHWPVWKAGIPVVCFLTFEASYVIGGISKIFSGAWLPVLVTLILWIVMKTWRDGRATLWGLVQRNQLPVEYVLDELVKGKIPRVRGTGVFMSSTAEGLPLVLLHHLKHNKALHEQVVLLSVKFHDVPRVGIQDRVTKTELAPNFFRIVLHYGFMESPDVMIDLSRALECDSVAQLDNISFYQSRELLLPTGRGKMAGWRKNLFIFLSRIARPATGYFQLPSRQVIELGIQMEL